MACKMIAYYRVSTARQGASGLGLDAQKAAVKQHVAAHGCDLIGHYTEIESGAKDDLGNRPALRKAIAHAKRSKATLVIAKLDRLSRSVYATAELHRSGVDFQCCDNPFANKLTIQILAVMAEHEAKLISERTKGALQAAKARGVLLGSHRPECRGNLSAKAAAKGRALGAQRARERATEAYSDLLDVLREFQEDGLTLREMASELNAAGHTTRTGKPWNAMQVSRVLNRIEAIA